MMSGGGTTGSRLSASRWRARKRGAWSSWWTWPAPRDWRRGGLEDGTLPHPARPLSGVVSPPVRGRDARYLRAEPARDGGAVGGRGVVGADALRGARQRRRGALGPAAAGPALHGAHATAGSGVRGDRAAGGGAGGRRQHGGVHRHRLRAGQAAAVPGAGAAWGGVGGAPR